MDPTPKFLQNSSEEKKLIILKPDEWLPSGVEGASHSPERGVFCIEDLAKREKIEIPIRVLEIGPTPVSILGIESVRVAPISLIYQRNPDWHCLAIGVHKPKEEHRGKLLGNVDFLEGPLGVKNIDVLKYYNSENLNADIIKKLGGCPQIVYGQHVFENSETGWDDPNPLPYGPYIIFEGAAELVAPNGFIVVDNHGGSEHQIGRDADQYSEAKLTDLKYIYKYDEDRAIYVFQKKASSVETIKK